MPATYKRHTLPTPYVVGDVHIYEVELAGKRILIDTGPPTPETKEYLTQNIDLPHLDLLLITHSHHDHFGQLRFIKNNSDAKILIPAIDHRLFTHHDRRIAFMSEYLQGFGIPDGLLRSLDLYIRSFKDLIPDRTDYELTEDNLDYLAGLGIGFVSCPGHSQSDLVFVTEDFAATGDTLLKDIFQTPLLDLDFSTLDRRFCNYKSYCSSIDKLRALGSRRILTSHESEIEDIESQVMFYIGKMVQRAAQLEQRRGTSKGLFDILIDLFPEIEAEPFKFYIKISEFFFFMDLIHSPWILLESLKRNGLLDRLDPAGLDFLQQHDTRSTGESWEETIK